MSCIPVFSRALPSCTSNDGGEGSDEPSLSLIEDNPSNCGGSTGYFRLSPGNSGMSADFIDALAGAESITLTGAVQSAWTLEDFTADPPAVEDEDLAEIVFSNVSYPMTFNGFSWATSNPTEGYDAEYMHWIRVDVDGELFYGIASMGTNC